MAFIPSRVFIHYLEQLHRLLKNIENQCSDEASLLKTGLADSMFPLAQQARTTIGFSLRTCCPLAGLDIVSFDSQETTFLSLQSDLLKTLDFLRSIPADSFAGYQDLQITTRAGFADHEMTGEDYLQLYALPNFFFHLSMVYAIARKQGITLSKGDFDGFHQYPEGFSF
ncbi:hypothetical protein BTA51_06855 [Hahella sp. CCB-MM4]|uniref:DUF1993 family protein n=1 Tax=Hahella sp. (strain CCB-MM4) TaxID=1926491 RepID=UPI000B9C348B|nr:DUF1993 domain-containing protein [Hahella sp. CCB-MM4]OZG74695.1 hypothetical protein BTA51_06855 [Hahella sp. CCB-MM4]